MLKRIREVTLFCCGDSTKLSTWSNVPFLFSKQLEMRGIKVNRVDISPQPVIAKWYNISILRLLSFFYQDNYFSYERSILNTFLTNYKIKKSIKSFPNSQLDIFMSLSFCAKKRPSVLLGDWTYQYIFDNRLKRAPYFFEKRYIDFQNKNICKANLVISLFRKCRDYIEAATGSLYVKHLGINVINDCNDSKPTDALIESKMRHKHIIFIGSARYKASALVLVEAFKVLKKKYPDLVLDIVGINEELNVNEIDIHNYGYLNKSVEKERMLYYKLLENATVFVNTTPQWAGYSATVESMYYYTPICITKYEDFVEDFGEDIAFGHYSENTIEDIVCKLESIFEGNYDELASAAHHAVKHYTWSNFMDKFLLEVDKIL